MGSLSPYFPPRARTRHSAHRLDGCEDIDERHFDARIYVLYVRCQEAGHTPATPRETEMIIRDGLGGSGREPVSGQTPLLIDAPGLLAPADVISSLKRKERTVV
jgi:hypothetical protein